MEDSEMTKPWVFLSRSLYVYLASFRARRHEFHIRTSQHSCLDPTFSAVCLRWKLNCESLHVRISSHALRAAMRGAFDSVLEMFGGAYVHNSVTWRTRIDDVQGHMGRRRSCVHLSKIPPCQR
ncbi:unnamed protein product [Mycena citricolor]|uniref:Uncharacterized protein n=1 Tax=Mycena citricolor TaxID=2018698 RepID=A0AAD2HPQ9_9AGAR|nr:unnamed protein product [Mycena citricolor]